jgi:sirohydrochlorin cobaltochelatase
MSAFDGAEILHERIHALLPPKYELCLDGVNPRSMGSASLKYDSNSQVAWDKIWTHYCDLALAGGPPHRGSLLESVTPDEANAEPAGYDLVVQELLRGIHLTTGLEPQRSPQLGWVHVPCDSLGMAAWLLRAIMAENVFVKMEGSGLLLPAGPTYRIPKEVKNVVVSLAKTYHYWSDHLPDDRKQSATELLTGGLLPSLIEPLTKSQVLAQLSGYETTRLRIEEIVRQQLGLPTVASQAVGWAGIRMQSERMAAWFVRSAIVSNILARREESVFYLPIDPATFNAMQSNATCQWEGIDRMVALKEIWDAEESGIIKAQSEHSQVGGSVT